MFSVPRGSGTPFPFEGPVTPDLLIDRHSELALLARRAGDRVNVRMLAPRRFGKTSLVLAHAQQLREGSGWRSAHVDFSGATDLTDVARRLAVAYANLDARWACGRLLGVLARIGITISPAGVGFSMGPRPRQPDPPAAEDILLQMLDLPLTLYDRGQAPTLVIYDEFQDLLVARDDLDGLLRSRIQYHGDSAAYVFAGSEPSMMRELFESSERPFFGQADPMTLGLLPAEETFADLSARFEREQLDPGDALGPLVAFAEGHPQRTMFLAYLLSEFVADGHDPAPGPVVDAALARLAGGFQALWQSFSRVERVALSAAADGIPIGSRALATEHRIARSSIALAVERLRSRGQLCDRDGAVELVDPLLAEWLRRR